LLESVKESEPALFERLERERLGLDANDTGLARAGQVLRGSAHQLPCLHASGAEILAVEEDST
jgi:hypothetical protein